MSEKIVQLNEEIIKGQIKELVRPMLHPFRSVAARFAGAIADNGTDLSHSPSPFQSGCRSRCWPARRPAYWQTASSSCPSQMVWCCARHGCCSAPDGHSPDTSSDTATAPTDNKAAGVPASPVFIGVYGLFPYDRATSYAVDFHVLSYFCRTKPASITSNYWIF